MNNETQSAVERMLGAIVAVLVTALCLTLIYLVWRGLDSVAQ